jgi:hypothetical protein
MGAEGIEKQEAERQGADTASCFIHRGVSL